MQQVELSDLSAESSRSKRAISESIYHDQLEADEDIQAEDKPLMSTDLNNEVDIQPTEQDIAMLPRVSDKVPWRVYTVAFVELCERFSTYGTTILFQNFVQRSLLTSTGRAPHPDGDIDNNPGALGQGQQVATGLGTFFSFWSQTTPLLGAWVADTYLGRYQTIMVAIAIVVVGHVILVIAALPLVLQHTQTALVSFVLGLIVFGFGTGGFKPNISPLIAEQIVHDQPRISFDPKTGERVIIDPDQTAARIYNWFYLFINVGALLGQITMSYAALYVGYYLAFLLPTLMFLLCPVILLLNKKNYRLTRPQGSVLGPAVSFLIFAVRPHWSWNPLRTISNLRGTNTFWEDARPSLIPPSKRPTWMAPAIDDAWVSELRRGVQACSVLLWLPLYWLTYSQMNNNLTSQADTMRHTGVPPEIVSNLDPLALIILIPICDLFIYPLLRKRGVRLTPIRKTTLGFWIGSSAMLYAAFLQQYIYTHNACGYHPTEGLPSTSPVQDCPPAIISILYQAPIYLLVAISEILVSITSMEYAFTKAPKNMRSMIQAFALLMGALANLIGEGFLWLARDPFLVWNYGLMGVVAFVAGCMFWWCNKELDWEDEGLSPVAHVGIRSAERTGQNEEHGSEFKPERRGRSIDASRSVVSDDSEEDEETLLRDRLHRRMNGDSP
ncbi:hypothetical protein A1O7_02907 [Cladophialophora yegresii CBS 114405]|uniref:POT family proton-dependent oligopeptide transporter n=1 Tax=Cladophialophora yegresii CBS 114405 TaxID=1182544 RepID=W9WBW1_9EURO|nr:uncharacterized protein A1O7_02907 [Cladophialophora yegresii CBS 114405]EXJ62470.1 hypothetical protein A1O7_02907 [Cladophialophora yegresii CBS 114405]